MRLRLHGRRVRKTMYRDDKSVSRRVFVYNGYRLVAELDDLEESYGESVSKTWLWDPTGVFDNSPLEMQVWKEEEEYPAEAASSSESTTEYPTTAYPEESFSSSEETTEYRTMDYPSGNSSDNSALVSNKESGVRFASQLSRLPSMGLSSSPSFVENRKRYYYMNDGNRKIIALRTAEEGICATYSYGTYGHRLKTTGPQAGCNPFRFSSEYYDGELGLIYYNYRHYNPMDGHWLSRDPMEEQGGTNLYGFCGNNPASQVDNLGLYKYTNTGFSAHWGNIVREKRPWAIVCYKYYQKGDYMGSMSEYVIWNELARANKLNYEEREKWVKGYKPTPNPGDLFQVPNTFVIYTTKSEPWDKMPGHPVRSAKEWKLPILKEKFLNSGVHIVEELEKQDHLLFRNLWKTDGIFGFGFVGHGACDEDKFLGIVIKRKWCGVCTDDLNFSRPDEVEPLYKLAFIAAFSCGAKEAGWGNKGNKYPLSELGQYIGYFGRFTMSDDDSHFIDDLIKDLYDNNKILLKGPPRPIYN